MQLYAGLPVITNQITAQEQQGIPHHLLGSTGLHEQPWVVGTFVKKALGVIEEIRSRAKLPILVGGTHYYTQSLLFRDRLAEGSQHDQEKAFVDDTKEKWPMLKEPTEVLLEELRRVDPVMADRWHPNDRRKIQRSLEIYFQTCRKASNIYAEQREAKYQGIDAANIDRSSMPPDGLSMRFPTLLFWVHSNTNALRHRLDGRVDKMLDHGLLEEVRTLSTFAQAQAEAGAAIDETRGIWVSIGYKEFKSYAKALEEGEVDEKGLEKLKAEALERTKIATRQYAKRQLSWIRIKLVNALAQADARENLYLLDSSDTSSFDNEVVDPALELTRNFFSSVSPMPEATSMSVIAADMLTPRRGYDLAATPDKWSRQHCELCGVTCVTEEQWAMHVKSKAHRKLVSKRKKAENDSSRCENDTGDGVKHPPNDILP